MAARCVLAPLVALVAVSSALVTPVTERRLRPEGDPMKLHPAWEGDLVDMAVGACFGGCCGAVLGVTLQRVAGALALVASNCAFSAVLLKLAASHGYVTVHEEALRDTANFWLDKVQKFPFLRKLGGGKRRRRRKNRRRRHDESTLSFLDALGDVEQLEEIATRNEHAVLGVIAGFLFGFLRVVA
mmetsp:Transcript_21816/g.67197  ORF Transcript_21816/g.67197 Transcript_21816/m.67197 type:complete len:185 (+) Transcript_21816:96-650(+)